MVHNAVVTSIRLQFDGRPTVSSRSRSRSNVTASRNHAIIFRLDALALSIIATATWLAGWVAGWLSHSGIVSKRLNLSENFLDHLKAASF